MNRVLNQAAGSFRTGLVQDIFPVRVNGIESNVEMVGNAFAVVSFGYQLLKSEVECTTEL